MSDLCERIQLAMRRPESALSADYDVWCSEIKKLQEDSDLLQALSDASGMEYQHGLAYQMRGELRGYIKDLKCIRRDADGFTS